MELKINNKLGYIKAIVDLDDKVIELNLRAHRTINSLLTTYWHEKYHMLHPEATEKECEEYARNKIKNASVEEMYQALREIMKAVLRYFNKKNEKKQKKHKG